MIRLEDNGMNSASKSNEKSEVLKLLTNMIGVHNWPLWFAAALCLAVYLTELYFAKDDVHVKPDNVIAVSSVRYPYFTPINPL